jgi:hypothetical protein
MPNRNWVGPNNSSNNPGSGNWNVAAFWGGTVPGTGDSVTLGGNGSAAAYTVTLDTNPTVQSVTINSGKGLATLAVGARTLTVTNNGGSVVK